MVREFYSLCRRTSRRGSPVPETSLHSLIFGYTIHPKTGQKPVVLQVKGGGTDGKEHVINGQMDKAGYRGGPYMAELYSGHHRWVEHACLDSGCDICGHVSDRLLPNVPDT